MPTIPPARSPLPATSPISHRQVAESFGVGRRTLRPDPAPLPRRPGGRGSSPPAPGPTCSTSAAVPASRPGSSRRPAARCSASSPTRGWPSFARRSGLEVEVATFEAWDPAGREFDAVVAGQAWHWVDPVAGAAKAAQVLRPGGRLALFWHVFQPPPEVAEAFAAVYRRVVPDSPFAFQPSGDGPGRLLRRCSPRPPTGSGRRAGSATRSSGGSTGSGPTPATSGWTSCPPPARSPSSRRTSWRRCWRASAPPSTRWVAASRCATPRWRSPRPEPAPPDPRKTWLTAPQSSTVMARAGQTAAACRTSSASSRGRVLVEQHDDAVLVALVEHLRGGQHALARGDALVLVDE